MSKLEDGTEILFECDRLACPVCEHDIIGCSHTAKIEHAKNFTKHKRTFTCIEDHDKILKNLVFYWEGDMNENDEQTNKDNSSSDGS